MRKIVLLAWLLAPALHAQLLTPVDMQNCVWRNGDNAGWADAGLDEDGWQPTAQWQLDPKQPIPVGALPRQRCRSRRKRVAGRTA